jgi:hypothetical protein
LGGGLNIIKNIRNVYGARELMGRAIVPMKPFCESTGSTIEQTHDVGLQDWSSIGGPVSGCPVTTFSEASLYALLFF